jgi:hypothetical protein
MKKIFTTLMVVMMASAIFAQNAMPAFSTSSVRKSAPVFGIDKNTKDNVSGWYSYANFLYNAYMPQDGIESGSSVMLCIDTFGLVHYIQNAQDTVGYYSHPQWMSACQVYDFTSEFFDEVSDEGDVSFNQTNSFDIDSIAIVGLYFRNRLTPGRADTLIVSFVDAASCSQYSFTGLDNTCFYHFPANHATGVVEGASYVFKLPIDENDVAEQAFDEQGNPAGYYYSEFDIPVNIQGVNNKIWNIALTFKRGYNLAMTDTIADYSHFRLATLLNPNPNYNYPNNDPSRCTNMSHGGYVLNFSNGLVDYYYPGFMFDKENYPRIYFKASCTDCAIVGVEEMEKENITVYPNPATNVVNVKLAGDKEAKVQMFNLVGQQVYNGTATSTASINVSNMKAGVYMLKISQNGKVYTSKVVVK